jgi:hypothetical protein
MNKGFILLSFLAVIQLASAQDTVTVLFIGNSFTFMNDMPNTFREIAKSKGKTVYVERVTEGGKSLEWHSKQERTYTTIRSRKWDFVVLQELSNTPAQPDSKTATISFPFFKQIADSVRANAECTQLMLYMTWGYKNGNSQWAEINTYEAMQNRITNTYLRFTDLLNAQLAPVGVVWSQVRKSYPALELYDPDNFHPSPLGSYLAAATFYAAIFGDSPYGSKYYAGLDPYTVEMIQLTASQTVLNNLNQWRLAYNNTFLYPAFDVIIKGNQVRFENRSEGYTEVEWDFGNGVVTRELNPNVRMARGKYVVKLTVKNQCKSRVLYRTIVVD